MQWNLIVLSLPVGSFPPFLLSSPPSLALSLSIYECSTVGFIHCWRTCQLSWMAHMALWEYWVFLPSPGRGGCLCSPRAPGCGCLSSEAVLCVSRVLAVPLRRSGYGTLQWHRKDCCPGMGYRPSLYQRVSRANIKNYLAPQFWCFHAHKVSLRPQQELTWQLPDWLASSEAETRADAPKPWL